MSTGPPPGVHHPCQIVHDAEFAEACGGSRIAAARQLGISERTLRYRLASFREAGIAVAGGRR